MCNGITDMSTTRMFFVPYTCVYHDLRTDSQHVGRQLTLRLESTTPPFSRGSMESEPTVSVIIHNKSKAPLTEVIMPYDR